MQNAASTQYNAQLLENGMKQDKYNVTGKSFSISVVVAHNAKEIKGNQLPLSNDN
jgi:hypothetical protein